MNRFLLSLCFLPFAGMVNASPVDEHIDRIAKLSEASCRAEEETLRSLYKGHDQRVGGTISFIAEGTRLICETVRIDTERQRLRGEQERLRSEAARLEAEWQSAHRINPTQFPDRPGRDASQQRLLKDADNIGGTLSVLGNVHSNLEAEARRILRLASEEFALLRSDQSEVIVASLDGVDEYDVIIRLLEQRRLS